ncbi:hypothetical protein FR483_n761L [Paramecium bursaria Chlorella virus FR483]|uniref:Uncharacterized protein n761L n=1 Tax=Paramecium bursaria Chlorella virus FR483 TaxID=399781 RepID=A7J8B5_PBCVF|nr:hypothetical protein FR483_n761L [Paramecium bursaria Chlorella virus FR483]ABT16046.1 hypothetical protein FR483_n761L [Paramecium bursaria Chlorella virus FR483]
MKNLAVCSMERMKRCMMMGSTSSSTSSDFLGDVFNCKEETEVTKSRHSENNIDWVSGVEILFVRLP